MLPARTTIEYREGAAAIVSPIVGVDRIVDVAGDRQARLAAEQAMDQVLADSFPASDPPSWNPGIIRPQPATHGLPAQQADKSLVTADVIDVSRTTHGDRAFLQALVSLFGAAGVALLCGIAILLVGLPIALVVRGLLEAIGWLFGISIR
jgi:hypothetical protein